MSIDLRSKLVVPPQGGPRQLARSKVLFASIARINGHGPRRAGLPAREPGEEDENGTRIGRMTRISAGLK
jgi:hypothetical protein